MEEMKALLVEFGQNMLQEIDQRMDARLDAFEKKMIETVDARLDAFEQKIIQEVDQKIQKLEAKMEDGFQTVAEKFEETDRKFEQLEKTILDKQFVFEQEYGKKIDLMYDAIVTELDKNKEKSEKIRKLDARTERCEMSLFDHEKRISVLERS